MLTRIPGQLFKLSLGLLEGSLAVMRLQELLAHYYHNFSFCFLIFIFIGSNLLSLLLLQGDLCMTRTNPIGIVEPNDKIERTIYSTLRKTQEGYS